MSPSVFIYFLNLEMIKLKFFLLQMHSFIPCAYTRIILDFKNKYLS